MTPDGVNTLISVNAAQLAHGVLLSCFFILVSSVYVCFSLHVVRSVGFISFSLVTVLSAACECCVSRYFLRVVW